MTRGEHTEITRWLTEWSEGERDALEKLTPLVYNELHRLAHHYMAREKPGHTLQTTALVNEVYLRLGGLHQVNWQNRAHFFALCARIMRHILTDYARSRNYLKRGGEAGRIALDEIQPVSPELDSDLVALDHALERLAAFDARKSEVVELRFFGGLNVREIAEVLKVSEPTVMRDWNFAKVWLLREMRGSVAA